jgi:hypothetical protein
VGVRDSSKSKNKKEGNTPTQNVHRMRTKLTNLRTAQRVFSIHSAIIVSDQNVASNITHYLSANSAETAALSAEYVQVRQANETLLRALAMRDIASRTAPAQEDKERLRAEAERAEKAEAERNAAVAENARLRQQVQQQQQIIQQQPTSSSLPALSALPVNKLFCISAD